MGRPPDIERRAELLDAVVAYLGEHGLADVSLRPMATAVGISVNGLVHHFGSKEELVVAALARVNDIQSDVLAGWLRRSPGLTQSELTRRWWRWITTSPEHLAMVRLGIEAAAMEASATGLPGTVRAEQVTLWRAAMEQRLVSEGVAVADATIEATLAKALFTGLVVDLLATGDRHRLTRALDIGLTRAGSRPTGR